MSQDLQMSFTDVPQFRKQCDEDESMDLMNELIWRFGNTVLHATLYDHMLNVRQNHAITPMELYFAEQQEGHKIYQ